MPKVMFQVVAPGFQHIVVLIFGFPTTSTRFNYFSHIVDINGMISHKSIMEDFRIIGTSANSQFTPDLPVTHQDHTMSLLLQNVAPPTSKKLNISEMGINGLAIALMLISTWAISLGLLLTVVNVSQMSLGNAIAVLLQTFLYTGLFITAHDAMHGAVLPKQTKINAAIGSFALTSLWLIFV